MNAWHTYAAHAADRVWYGGSAWRWPLLPLAAIFRSLAASRAMLYRAGLMRSVRLPVPVVVVGNLTVGGTGKTPFAIWLTRELAARGRSPGIVTRGYGGRAASWPRDVTADASADEVGDEPVLLAARTGRPVQAGPDRVAAAEALLRDAPEVDVIVSDDGLQHYRLARAFEIAVVDGARGLGNGLCLPAGPLREPGARLRTVDAIVVNKGVRASGGARRGAAGDVSASAPRAASANAPSGVVRPLEVEASDTPRVSMSLVVTRVYRLSDGRETRLDAFQGQTVHAVAGIGHPERFFGMLEDAGLTVLRHPLPDHARVLPEDLPREPAVPVLTTEKDGVKLRGTARDDVWCVAVDAEVDGAEAARLWAAIERAIEAHPEGASGSARRHDVSSGSRSA